MAVMILGLVIFLGTHLVQVFTPGVRAAAVEKIGLGPWKGIYSLVSLIGAVAVIYGFGLARLDPIVIWVPPSFMKHIAFTLLLPVFPLLLAAYLPGRISTTLKHPMLAAVKFWALAHLLVNGTLAHIVLFGGFLGWAVLVRISAKRHPRAALPLGAPSLKNDLLALVAGLILYLLTLFYFHQWLIGVSPLSWMH